MHQQLLGGLMMDRRDGATNQHNIGEIAPQIADQSPHNCVQMKQEVVADKPAQELGSRSGADMDLPCLNHHALVVDTSAAEENAQPAAAVPSGDTFDEGGAGEWGEVRVLEMGALVADTGDELECRICHLGLRFNHPEDGDDAIELGCACKHDLAVAHRSCAEVWFKCKGNRNCEICGVFAKNIDGLEVERVGQIQGIAISVEPSNLRWWHRTPILNLLISILVVAILLPWLFHMDMYK